MTGLALPGWAVALAAGVTGLPGVAGAVSPSPEPGVVTPPADLVTPGTVGFLVTFAVGVAVVLLARDMNRRVRRIRVRSDREDAQRSGTDGDGPVDGRDGLDRPQ